MIFEGAIDVQNDRKVPPYPTCIQVDQPLSRAGGWRAGRGPSALSGALEPWLEHASLIEHPCVSVRSTQHLLEQGRAALAPAALGGAWLLPRPPALALLGLVALLPVRSGPALLQCLPHQLEQRLERDAWLPAEGDDFALWHLVHDDGDEEDLEEHEVVAAIEHVQGGSNPRALSLSLGLCPQRGRSQRGRPQRADDEARYDHTRAGPCKIR